MKEQEKQQVLALARAQVHKVQNKILEVKESLLKMMTNVKKDARSLTPGDQLAQMKIVQHNQQRVEDLKSLYPSPFFVRCDVKMKNSENEAQYYFAKFSLPEENIYSWVTPAAMMRFENPGRISYHRLDGKIIEGMMKRRDQYLIVEGKILFLASEAIGVPRELIHQEHFSTRKSGFMLPEIVSQMEKAQDQVVRAHHVGPFVISGPAGSGKTTLALHRVAYLMQSPDTAEFYQPSTVIVFVQDNGTHDYFSHLLPELGIKNVQITTMAAWGLEILGLSDKIKYMPRYGENEAEKDRYDYHKLLALRAQQNRLPEFNKNVYVILQKIYERYFDIEDARLFAKQKKEKIIDRFDLTLLLQMYRQKEGELKIVQEGYEESKNGSYRKRKITFSLEYTLMIVDEFQNYLPEQLEIMKKCLQKRLLSIIYVGDMAQQIQLGTLREWSEIKEKITEDRKVILQKVYRNTKNILRYIRSVGYNVEIPESLKDGEVVVEKIAEDKNEEIEMVKQSLVENEGAMIGVLAKEAKYLDEFKKLGNNGGKVRYLSMMETQGVEFEVVCLVGITEEAFKIDKNLPEIVQNEKKRINKDLLYVALTRAMDKMMVIHSRPDLIYDIIRAQV